MVDSLRKLKIRISFECVFSYVVFLAFCCTVTAIKTRADLILNRHKIHSEIDDLKSSLIFYDTGYNYNSSHDVSVKRFPIGYSEPITVVVVVFER